MLCLIVVAEFGGCKPVLPIRSSEKMNCFINDDNISIIFNPYPLELICVYEILSLIDRYIERDWPL
jgi:hypothetical protein